MNWKKMIQILIFSIPVLFFFYQGYTHRWNSEDAFISFRVVNNLISGYGPVYNIDERVEAYTHPLWLAILSLSAMITKSIELSAVWLGLIFSCIGLLFGIIGGIKIVKSEETRNSLYIPLGSLVIASLPPFWDFATSGLETGLTFLWLGVSFFISADFLKKSEKFSLALIWFSLGPLVRPDLGILWIGFMTVSTIIFVFFHKRKFSFPTILKFLISSLLLPLSHQIFRMGYFASLLPNPALAKEAFSFNVKQGFLYLLDFIFPYALYIPLILCITVILRLSIRNSQPLKKEKILYLAFFILGLFHITYVILIGGDFMHGRFLLPGFFSIFLSIPLIPCKGNCFTTFLVSSGLTWCFICAILLRVSYVEGKYGITNERKFYEECAQRKNPVKIIDYEKCALYSLGMDFRRKAIRSEKKVFLHHENIGISGFVAGPRVHGFDMIGLADPVASRLKVEKKGRPGHEKFMSADWVIARIDENFDNMIANCARKAMQCGDLKDYLDSIQGEITVRKFIKNIFVATKTVRMRIPPDPCKAMQKFCGNQKTGIHNPK